MAASPVHRAKTVPVEAAVVRVVKTVVKGAAAIVGAIHVAIGAAVDPVIAVPKGRLKSNSKANRR